VRQGSDLCYRFGGDEFAVLLSGSEGTSFLSTLGRTFPKLSIRGEAPISCSIGVVALREGESSREFVRRADELMYAAKRGELGAAEPAGSLLGKVSSRPPEAPETSTSTAARSTHAHHWPIAACKP